MTVIFKKKVIKNRENQRSACRLCKSIFGRIGIVLTASAEVVILLLIDIRKIGFDIDIFWAFANYQMKKNK